jgi:hypothetical protein
MKTKRSIFSFANTLRKNAFLLLAASSLTLPAQTIQQRTTLTGNVINSLNGINEIDRALDVISLDETRVITTTRKTNTSYELIAWEVSANAITKKGSWVMSATANGIRSAKLSNTRFANAYTRNSKLYLEVWDVTSDGYTFTLKGTKTGDDLYSDYRDFAFIALSSSRLISITINPDEKLTFTTWDVASNGTITQAATSLHGGEMRGNLPAAALSSSKFVVTYPINFSSDITWLYQVNAAGAVTELDSYGPTIYSRNRLAAISSSRFVFAAPTGFVNDHKGYLLTWSVSASNVLNIGTPINSLVEAIDGSITKLNSSNVLTADIAMATGKLTLCHAKIASDGTPSKRDEVVYNGTGKQARVTTLLDNTTLSRVVTGMITSDNKLRLTSWDITIGVSIPGNATGMETGINEQQQFTVFPNPASIDATITFNMDEDARASLKIYNSLGELMTELVNENFSKGTHQILFPVEKLASGVYYYSVETEEKQLMNKLVVVH